MKKNILLMISLLLLFNSIDAQDWKQILRANASDNNVDDYFGTSVAIDGDYAIVGADYEDEDANGKDTKKSAGSAYIFKNEGGIWKFKQKLVPNYRFAGDHFGISVAIKGDYVIVGAYGSNIGKGKVYIFKLYSGIWKEEQTLEANDAVGLGWFGFSVAFNLDYIVVGAILETKNASGSGLEIEDAGAVYIFKQSTGWWAQQQKIVAPDRAEMDKFGYSVAISDDFIIVGAPYEDENTYKTDTKSSAGSAYVFKQTAGVWKLQNKIVSADRAEDDEFGYTVSINGEYAIIGAPNEDENASKTDMKSSAGSAYIFKQTAGVWAQHQKIVATDREASNYFGHSLTINGDLASIGAPGKDNKGAVYIFKQSSGVWKQQKRLIASDRNDGDFFGSSTSLSGDFVITGAIGVNSVLNGSSNIGAVYFFKYDSTAIVVGFHKQIIDKSFSIKPNPTNGNVTIFLEDEFKNIAIEVRSIEGKLLKQYSFVNLSIIEIDINEPSGIYFISIQSGCKNEVLRLVKN